MQGHTWEQHERCDARIGIRVCAEIERRGHPSPRVPACSPVPFPPIAHVDGDCGRHGRGWSRGSRYAGSRRYTNGSGYTQINRCITDNGYISGNGYTNGSGYTRINRCTKDNGYISGDKYSVWREYTRTQRIHFTAMGITGVSGTYRLRIRVYRNTGSIHLIVLVIPRDAHTPAAPA